MIDGGLVAVVRFADPGPLVRVVQALADGGIAVAEVTLPVTTGALVRVSTVTAAVGRLVPAVLMGARGGSPA